MTARYVKCGSSANPFVVCVVTHTAESWQARDPLDPVVVSVLKLLVLMQASPGYQKRTALIPAVRCHYLSESIDSMSDTFAWKGGVQSHTLGNGCK